MSHKQNPHGKKRETKDNSSTGTTPHTHKQSDHTSREPEAKLSETSKGLRWLPDWFLLLKPFDRIMTVLTVLGLVITAITGGIFWLQLHEMRTDQRAWINMTTAVAQYPKGPRDGQLVVNATINNVGKTAAKRIYSQVVLDYVVNGQSPDFIYDGRVRVEDSTGSIFPNTPHTIQVTFQEEPKTGVFETRYLTQTEFNDLANGNAYMAVYAHTEYVDIFGTSHWLHFCTFFVAPNVNVVVTAKACTDYNDTDSN